MLSLRELQTSFRAAMLGTEEMPVAALVHADGTPPSARLAIYRNNIFHNLREALRDVYPVVERLVGGEYFTHAAEHYIRQHPSTSGDIHRFGALFPAFMEGFCPSLAYLGDTARLEWAWHAVFHAGEHPPLSLARLAEVPEDRYLSLTFTLHPACRLLSSAYPVHRIWQFNQPDADGDQTIRLEEGGTRLLLHRENSSYAIAIVPLDPGEYALLAELARGGRLEVALGCACEVQADFDITATLQRHVASGTLADFAITDA
jgi:hypothetical protein